MNRVPGLINLLQSQQDILLTSRGICQQLSGYKRLRNSWHEIWLHLTESNSIWLFFRTHLSVWNVCCGSGSFLSHKRPGMSRPWITFAKSGLPSIETYSTFLHTAHWTFNDSHTLSMSTFKLHGFSMCFVLENIRPGEEAKWASSIASTGGGRRWYGVVPSCKRLRRDTFEDPTASQDPHGTLRFAPRHGNSFANPLGARKNACSSSGFSSATKANLAPTAIGSRKIHVRHRTVGIPVENGHRNSGISH